MRLIVLSLLLALNLATANAQTATPDVSKLNGTWLPVRQELAGNPLHKSMYETQTLIINDSNYTVIAKSLDKGVIRYQGNKMDIYSRVGFNAGKHFTAIYKLENGQLVICYNLAGDSYPSAFVTKDKKKFFLSVFSRP